VPKIFVQADSSSSTYRQKRGHTFFWNTAQYRVTELMQRIPVRKRVGKQHISCISHKDINSLMYTHRSPV